MRRWNSLLIVPYMVLALIVVSYGDDDSSEAGDGSSSAGGIKLGFSAWPGWFPWQVAEDAGLFKQVDVDVDLVWFEGYLDSINALAGDSSTRTARR